MRSLRKTFGFTMVEMLMVLATIGIISAIAIPSLLGSRQNARMVGDARANLSKLQMELERYASDNGGIYPPAGAYTWTSAGVGTRPPVDPAPRFVVTGGNSILDYTLNVAATRLSYTITATDNTRTTPVVYLTLDQNGTKQ